MAIVITGKKTNKEVLILSLVVFVYFYTMFCISAYRDAYKIIGVLIEILTIPMLAALTASTFLSIVQMIKEKFTSGYPICSFILSLSVIIGLLSL